MPETPPESSLSQRPAPFWDRDVIFVSNIFSLFFGNETQIAALHDEVGALETYGCRMVPILNLLYRGKSNVLILEANPDPALMDYFTTLGLTVPPILVPQKKSNGRLSFSDLQNPEIWKIISESSAGYVNGYVTDEMLEKVSAQAGKTTISSIEGCYKGNNKLALHRFLKENNLPNFDTDEAKNPVEAIDSFGWLLKKGYRKAVIKSQIGASGIGMKKFDLPQSNPEDVPAYLFFDGPALVQGWLDEKRSGVKTIASPSVLLFISDEKTDAYDFTEQILSADSVHEGNVSPPSFLSQYPHAEKECQRQALLAGEWAREQGYRGTASVDFLLTEENGEAVARICEINARVTGATYPSLLAKNLAPGRTWVLRNIRFFPERKPEEILDLLKKEGILFGLKTRSGALPFNLNVNEEGKAFKGQFVFIDQERAQAFEFLDKTFSLFGGIDRD